MRILLNRNADTPIYMQIKNQIKDMIATGTLPEKSSLPSERELAKTLHINRSTVIKAYQELKADGLISSHIGKGTTVLSQLFQNSSAANQYINPIPWHQLFNNNVSSNTEHIISDIMAISTQKKMVSFAGGFPSPNLFPMEILKKLQLDLYQQVSEQLFSHTEVEGYYPLRESISYLLKKRQIQVSAKEILLLAGSQQGLDFIARIFLNKGDTILVEEPTFFGAIQIFQAAGAHIVGIPIDKNGILTDRLETALLKYKPKLIYVLPTFQNPSGSTMSLERRRQLLELAYQHQVPIIEDDPYGELRYDGAAIPTLKSLDHHDHVIYLSTFSKVLFLGLRVGWIVAPPQVITKFAHLKQLTDLHVNTPGQLLLDQFLRQGHYEKHIIALCQEYTQCRNTMLAALEKYQVPGISWSTPQGGYYIWCKLPQSVTRHKLINNAAKRGVVFLPGEACFPDGTQGENFIRLNYTFPHKDQIKQGIKHLMQAVKETAENTINE